ncbi:MAG TPA: alanine racemase [bacterium]|nr:alanine racemase [bacterium]
MREGKVSRERSEKTGSVAAKIDLHALKYNFGVMKRKTGKEIIPVVKANAYGHGILEVSRFLEEKCGVKMLAAARMSEGEQLRKGGIKSGILILNGAEKNELKDAVKYNLVLSVYSAEKLREISDFCLQKGKKISVHLKFNTGMNRLGLPLEYADTAKNIIEDNVFLELEGVYTHFADADRENDSRTLKQAKMFEGLKKVFGKKVMYHAANSAAAVRYKAARFDAVRPGIMLYGCLPVKNFPKGIKLRPVMSLSAPVLQVKKINKGDRVSYGGKYTAKKSETAAIIAVGYGDGFFRSLSEKGYVMIKGKKAPVLGAVCMDMTAVRAPKGTKPGDSALVFGKSGKYILPVEDAAKEAGTIPYEILTGITDRVERVYR